MKKLIPDSVLALHPLDTHTRIHVYMYTELEEMGARMLGKESARFFPTGLMGNLASGTSGSFARLLTGILTLTSHVHMPYMHFLPSSAVIQSCHTVGNVELRQFSETRVIFICSNREALRR